MKPAYELLNKEYLTAQEIADALGISKKTFLGKYAPRPDFPARITLTQKTFFWLGSDIKKYLDRRKEKRPH